MYLRVKCSVPRGGREGGTGEDPPSRSRGVPSFPVRRKEHADRKFSQLVLIDDRAQNFDGVFKERSHSRGNGDQQGKKREKIEMSHKQPRPDGRRQYQGLCGLCVCALRTVPLLQKVSEYADRSFLFKACIPKHLARSKAKPYKMAHCL